MPAVHAAVHAAVIAAFVIGTLWTSGCSGGEPSAVTPASDEVSADAVDACALLSAEDIEAVIGVPFDGVPSGAGGRSECRWENPDTGESVTVVIGEPNSARGLDGTRIVAGTVEFAADDRSNSVRVASAADESPDAAVAAALRLIERIRPQMPD
jgi:hypothetical protein